MHHDRDDPTRRARITGHENLQNHTGSRMEARILPAMITVSRPNNTNAASTPYERAQSGQQTSARRGIHTA